MSLAPINTILAHTIFHVPSYGYLPYQMKTDQSTFTTHARAGWEQPAPSLLALGLSRVSHRILIPCGVFHPTSLQGWELGTDYNHLLKSYYSDEKNENYKLLNGRNTRKTGQNDQILYHAWNSLSLNNFQCIQLTSPKVWDKWQGSYRLRLTLELDHRCMGLAAQRQCVNVSAALSPLTVQLRLGEFVGRLFLVWEFLYCQIYPFKIFLRQRKCNRKPAAY